MLLCYVDESGDTGAFEASERNSQPLFLLAAVMVQQSHLAGLTQAIIDLKRRFFPAYANGVGHWHDWLKVGVKGANLRRALREGNPSSMRHVIVFLEHVIRLMEEHRVRIVARIYLKRPSTIFDGAVVYSAAVQRLTMAFEERLRQDQDQGIVILDSRNKIKNVPVAHSIFTMNFGTHGQRYEHLAEVPLFGHSENHAMLQLADWVGSAFLFPMATRAYYANVGDVCVHADPSFETIRTHFGQRLKALQYRYVKDGRKLGGVAVLGGDNCRVNPLLLFGMLPQGGAH